MSQIEEQIGGKVYTAESVAPMTATLCKSGRLSFTHATARAIDLEHCVGAYFNEGPNSELRITLRREDSPGMFKVQNRRFIGSKHFFKHPDGIRLANGATKFRLKDIGKDMYELEPLNSPTESAS